MADIANTIISLASSISTNASRVKVNKRVCKRLERESRWIEERVRNGELGPPTGIAFQQLQKLLVECDKDLKKFAGSGLFRRFLEADAIGQTCESHLAELEVWLGRIPEKTTKEDANRDLIDDKRYLLSMENNRRKAVKMASSNPTARIIGLPVVNLDDLGVDRTEVGEFSLGTIYEGTYKGEPVYIRELRDDIPNISHIKAGIMLAKCISDCSNIVQIHGICGRIIVTAKPANGPLSEYRQGLTRLQKTTIAHKVADALLYMHDLSKDVSVVHRDIRAANILLTDELEPKITGFEMCKEEGAITGHFPEVEARLKKWWAPERLVDLGTSPETDVYAFGVLMYEISTGREPEDGMDLVTMDGGKICPEYTELMKECLEKRINARPKMDEIVERLLSLETMLR
ncbi:hypothetical protein BGZ79_000209 [Entomortierella chlamydospora]|nr:hypothetical protein BGZ79_000209 [Entomortierella chlamydospora]